MGSLDLNSQIIIVSILRVGVFCPGLALESADPNFFRAVIVVDAREVVFAPLEVAVKAVSTLILELGPGLDFLETADLSGAVCEVDQSKVNKQMSQKKKQKMMTEQNWRKM